MRGGLAHGTLQGKNHAVFIRVLEGFYKKDRGRYALSAKKARKNKQKGREEYVEIGD